MHAQCVSGGLKPDHELVPKKPADNEAKETVIRIRDNILHAAADVEVVLPIHDPHDDSSTDTPDDEDTLFDREEALRHDDAIMDFQWFSTISWDEIKDLRGTTYVQPPTRLKFALQQAQHAILRAILYNEPSSPMSEPAWKVLLLSSWLLLGRPAENASEANCASFLETRLDLSGLKTGLLYGPWYVLNATFPPLPKHVRGQRPNKLKLEFAKLLRLPGRARKDEH